MSPVRIVILAVLFYILFRLLFGKKKAKKPLVKASESPVSGDVLVEDPVCHTFVPKKQAIHAIKNGETYYFCSEKCCQDFLADNGKAPDEGKEGDKT